MTTAVPPVRNRKLPRSALLLVVAAGLTLALALPYVAFQYFQTSGASVTGGQVSRGASDAAIDIAPNATGFEGAPSISYDASLVLESLKPAEAIERAAELVRSRGGSIAVMNVTTNETETASATFRVPAPELTPMLNDIANLGTVEDKTLSARDVGPTIDSINSQIVTTQAQVDRLTRDIQTVPPAQRPFLQRQLDQAQAQLDALRNQVLSVQQTVTYATLAVSISTEAVGFAERTGMDAFSYAVEKGWDATLTLTGLLISVLGFTLPLLLIVAVLLVVAAGMYRLARRTWSLAKPLFR